MKTKQKVDSIIDSFLVVIGILVIFAAIFKCSEVKLVFSGVMFAYAILNLVQFLLTKSSKDYEGLYTFLASLVVGISALYFEFNTNVLSICIMSWTTMMAIIKFIKTDYYNDRKDKMWKLRVITLVLFMMVGFLVSASLNYSQNVQVMVLGYFFFINGILELVDPITKYLIGK